MDFSMNLENALRENRLISAYGPSINITALRILSIAQSLTNGVVFYAFKSNQEARYAYNVAMTLGEGIGIGLATGDRPLHENPEYDIYSNSVIYCTTGKLRNILLDQMRREQLGMIGWVMIESWHEYDANAYVVANLARKYTEASVTLLSSSEWSHLPYNDSISVPCPQPELRIVYTTSSIASLSNAIKEHCIFYGREVDIGPLQDRAEYGSQLTFNKDAHIVVDTLKDSNGRPISKYLADVRADSIHNGIVYRLSTEAAFDALRARDPIKIGSSLEEAVLYVQHANLDPLEVFGTNHPREQIQKIMSTLTNTKLGKLNLDKVISLRLGVVPGIFYVSWTGRGHRGERNRYIPGLIAALIEYPPVHYAPLGNYSTFVGRNDIETLCNVWSSLLLSHSGPFWNWSRERPIENWCKEHGFNYVAITKLISNMKRVCLGMKGEMGLFDKIKTDELNTATEVFRELEASRGAIEVVNWDKSGTLPTAHVTSANNILPVLHSGRSLELYIDRERIFAKTSIRAENVEMFFGM